MKQTVRISIYALILVIVFLTAGCTNGNSYFITGTREQQKELKNLFSLLEAEHTKPESKFVLIKQISKILIKAADKEVLNLFLTVYVENHPDDPFNAYYLLIVAQNYMKEEAYPFAAHYYERILKNYSDLLVRGKSVHYLCIQDLIKMTEDHELRVTYYKELISRFSDEIDKGSTYYWLAQTYEAIGEWELAIQAFNNFLQYQETSITGVPKAWDEVKAMVDFYNYDGKNWTMDSLEELIKQIRYAINRRDTRQLKKYMAKVNFFTMSWEQTENPKTEVQFIDHFSDFLGARVWCSPDVDRDSNEQEAYLRTSGWSYRIQTWYLYFRKVYFPADPEKHGQWEWAGIYFGEKPFASMASS